MYHCYFLINYIGPPKVFFLSFGPLFKKFAHHWFRARYFLVFVIMPRLARITLSQTPLAIWHHGIYLHILYVTFYVLELLHDLSYA